VKDKAYFFFTAKLHQDFTHRGLFSRQAAADFRQGFEPLVKLGKLRYLLMQFKYDFIATQENKAYLEKLVKEFAVLFAIVIEVRHNSWQQPEALEFLSNLQVTLCNPDYPVGKDSFYWPECRIGTAGYMRLHGRNREKWFSKSSRDETYDYYYPRQEVQELAERIRQLALRHQKYMVIGNNHYRGAAVANALRLKHLLTGLKQRIPGNLREVYPDLEEIAELDTLF